MRWLCVLKSTSCFFRGSWFNSQNHTSAHNCNSQLVGIRHPHMDKQAGKTSMQIKMFFFLKKKLPKKKSTSLKSFEWRNKKNISAQNIYTYIYVYKISCCRKPHFIVHLKRKSLENEIKHLLKTAQTANIFHWTANKGRTQNIPNNSCLE